MGVKYVLVHHNGYLKTELFDLIEEFRKIPSNPGLRLVKTFPPQKCSSEIMCTQKAGPIDVYEVIAQPREPEVK